MSVEKSSKTPGKISKQKSDSQGSFDIFRVLLHNDNITPMHFVTQIIQTVFERPPAEAYALMFEAHIYGVVVIGFFPRDIADAYIDNVHSIATHHGYALRCSKVGV